MNMTALARGALANGYMQLVYYSAFNGFVGVFVKLAHGLDMISVVFFRALLAFAFVGLVALVSNQGSTLRLHNLRATLLVGLFQGLMITLIMSALRQTSVSSALFLLYTAPVFTVLLARLFLGECISSRTWASIAVALLGILLMLNPQTLAFGTADALGNLMALGAGLSLAAMTITAKSLSKQVSGYYIVFWQYLLITLLALPFVRIDSPSTVLANWWQLGGLGIICTGIAFIWYMRGVQRVPAQHVLVVTSLEPLFGTAIAALLLHESLSALTLAGAALILAGAFGVTSKRATCMDTGLDACFKAGVGPAIA